MKLSIRFYLVLRYPGQGPDEGGKSRTSLAGANAQPQQWALLNIIL
jgi:hypothetical protein